MTALEKVNLTVAIELLHGLFYSDFDSYFDSYNRSELHIHSPNRTNRMVPRSMWMSVIDKDIFDSAQLDLPFNLPSNFIQRGQKQFENRILIDRPSNVQIGDISFSKRFQNRDGHPTDFNGTENGTIVSPMIYDDDGRMPTSPYPVRDPPSRVQENELWWTTGDQIHPSRLNREFSFLTLPYLPFFSNCEGYDSHISLSRLLEEHPNCSLVDFAQTRPVYQFRWFDGSAPLSDSCRVENSDALGMFKGIDLHCLYEEEVDVPTDNFRWFESEPGTTLFYLSKEAVPPEHFEAKFEASDDGRNELLKQRWGRAPEIERLRGSFNLVPVLIDEIKGGLRNTIPRVVELDIQYYQVNQGKRRLVAANIYFSDLCTTLKPRHFGGNGELLDLMEGHGIFPCDVDIRGNLKSHEYTLRIHFYPLDWFNLLNSFEFGGFVYLVFFTFVGLFSMFLGGLVWGVNRLLTKLRYPPAFHGWSLAKLIVGPPWLGCVVASIPTSICLSIAYMWFSSHEKHGMFASSDPVQNPSFLALEGVGATWLSNSVLDKGQIEQNRIGRMGTAMLAVGIYTTVLGASLIVPEFRGNRNRDNVADGNETDNNKDKDGELTLSNSWAPTTWKRYHLIFSSLCLESFLLWIWEYSYSSFFEDNVFRFILVFKIGQMVFELFLGHIMREKLIIVPLIVVVEVTEILVTIGAANLVEFTATHFVEMSIILVERLYFDPYIKKLQNLWPRWKMIIKRKLTLKRRMTRTQKQEEELRWRKVNEEIELRSEGVEPLLDSMGLFSVEITGGLLTPFICLFLMVFYQQTQMAENYGIQENEIGFYALFALYMIPWTSAIDVLSLNAQELIHGWRLYDYMAYQRYRFSMRENRWALSSVTVDESISQGMQTLDLLCFSSQYYFIVALFSISMLTNMFAMTVLLRSEFNFLGDPVTPIIMLSMIIICELMRVSMIWLGNVKITYLDWRGLWTTKQIEGTMDDAVAAKLAVGEGRQADLEQERIELQALNNEQFRRRFLDRNRPWLLQHLVELITPSTLAVQGPDQRPLVDYIRDVYDNLIRMNEGERKPGDRSDISSDEGDDEEMERIRQWDRRPLKDSNLAIAKLWLQKARKRRAFSKAVNGIVQSHEMDRCSFCSRRREVCDYLVVSLANNGKRDPYAIDDLISQFETQFSVNENDVKLWQSFFRSHAEYVTTCNICMDHMESVKLDKPIQPPGGSRPTRPGDISSDDEEDDELFDPIIVVRSSNEGKMMSIWLEAARKRLGGSFPKPEAKRQVEIYVERLRNVKLHRVKGRQIFEVERPMMRNSAEVRPSWGLVELNDRSKILIIRWLKDARDNAWKRFSDKGEELRKKTRETLEKMKASDDWFYTRELRMKGKEVQSEGEKLSLDKKIKEAKEKSQIQKVESELEEFTDKVERQLRELSSSLDKQLSEAYHEAQGDSEPRLQELRRAEMELRTRHDEEELNAREIEGVVPEAMASRHREAIHDIEKQISEETKNTDAEFSKVETERRRDFSRQERAYLRDVHDKKTQAEADMKEIKKTIRSEIEQQDTEWREKASTWLSIAARKVAVKSNEDFHMKEADEKVERKKKRFQRRAN